MYPLVFEFLITNLIVVEPLSTNLIAQFSQYESHSVPLNGCPVFDQL